MRQLKRECGSIWPAVGVGKKAHKAQMCCIKSFAKDYMGEPILDALSGKGGGGDGDGDGDGDDVLNSIARFIGYTGVEGGEGTV